MTTLPRFKDFTIEPQQKLTFSAAEFERRLAGLREHLAEHDLDAVVLTGQHTIKYYSDFLFTGFGRMYGLVVTPTESITITSNIDAGMPWRTSYGDNIAYTDWQTDNFFHAVSELFRRRALSARRIGVEYDALTIASRDTLQSVLPGALLIDVADALMRRRLVKSDEEIELITQGARVADLAGAVIADAVRAGVTEYELALLGTEVMVEKIAHLFPERETRDSWVWFQSGPNTDGAHNGVTARQLKPGDLLSMNCFPMISGYYTALERTMHLGEPDPETLRMWRINVEVHRRGLELIRPGAVCREIARELNEMYREHDLLQYRTFGYGHSFGVLSHYYGRDAGIELREDSESVIEPGMVVSMEPMITIPSGMPGAGGYREHDMLVVEEHGARNITGFPFGPEHHIIPA